MATIETKSLMLNLRARELIEKTTHQSRRNLELEALSEISAEQWSNWWVGRARLSSEMLAALCQQNPEMCLWLMTGATDADGGQISPATPDERRQLTTIRYLRRLCEIMALKNPQVGVDLWEHEVEELNTLAEIRRKELVRRLSKNNNESDQTASEIPSAMTYIPIDVNSLISRLTKKWTFHDTLRAQYLCLQAIGTARNTPQIQALLIGLKASQKKIALPAAFEAMLQDAMQQDASKEEVDALKAAGELLRIG